MTRLLERLSGYLPTLLATALPVVFIPTAADSYILPRASLVIGGACVGLGLALVIGRSDGLGELRWAVIAAAGAAVIAFAFSISWPLSLAGSYTRYESLPMRLSYLGLFVSAAWLLKDRRPREWMVAGFVFGTCVACLEAVQQWQAHVAFRPDGNLGNANLLAALVAMAFPLAVQRVLRRDSFVLAWAAAVIVLPAGVLATTSRSGFLGAFAAVLVLGVLAVRGRAVLVAAGIWLAALIGAVAVIEASPLRALNDDPASLRLHLWSDGLRMIEARPLTGWGEDSTGLAFGHFLSLDYASLVTFDRIHSGPLDIAATQGLLGLAALGWVLFVLVRRTWAHRLEGDVAGLAAALVGYTVWVLLNFDWAPVTGVFWLLAGALWASVSPPRLPGRFREGTAAWRLPVAFALVVVAIVFAVLPLLADMWYLRGRADLAVRADPLQAQYHWALGTLPELRRAAELGETTPDMYVQLGDAELRAGDPSAARRAYQRALQIDPYFSPATERLAAMGD